MNAISIVTGSLLLLAILVLLFACLHLRKKLLARRDDRIETMLKQRERLQLIISELLSRVDEIDNECKYRKLTLNAKVSYEFEKTCSQLVVLGDSLKIIDERLDNKLDKEANRELKKSLQSAEKLSETIQAIRQAISEA